MTSPPSDHDTTEETDVHTLTGAYALDALDDLDRARVERHLSECTDCESEVLSFLETTARLGTGVAVTPPARLRDAVLAEIATTRQLAPTSSRREQAGTRPAASRATRWLSVAAASLLVLTVATGGVALSWRGDAEQARQAAAGMQAVLADPQREVVDADFGDGGHAAIVVSDDRMVLVGDGVQAPPPGYVFQLWLIGAEGPRPSVLLEPTGSGDFWAAAGGVREGDAFGITVEVEGGATTPSGDLVLDTQA